MSAANLPLRGSAANLPLRGPAAPPSPPRANKSRPKTQLSCKTCRKQKIRCDRERPCSTCLHKGLGDSCEYPEAITPDHSGGRRAGARARRTVQDRIKELESLIMNIVQSNTAAGTAVAAAVAAGAAGAAAGHPPPHQQLSSPKQQPSPMTEPSPRPEEPSPMPSQRRSSNVSAEEQRSRAPAAPKDESAGSIVRSHDGREISYVGSSHWEAILGSIAELKDHVSQLESSSPDTASSIQTPGSSSAAAMSVAAPGPLLFYDTTAPADRIAAIPARPIVDRLVLAFFRSWDKSTVLIHDIQFMRQYENFWRDPSAAPILWVGLLYAIMGWSALKQSIDEPFPSAMVMSFRERTVQCLRAGEYTKPGPHVIETLVLHCMLEYSLCADAQFGVHMLLGTLVQLARRMGYHRDASSFPPGVLTPFEGEMRRRVWAIISMVDIGSAAQLGLPMIINDDEVDTAEPRNLLNTDFDEDCAELPPSRPDSDPTPAFFMIIRARLGTVWRHIGHMVSRIEPCRYPAIMAAHRKLLWARHSLPLILRSSLLVGLGGGDLLPDIQSSSAEDWSTGIQRIFIHTTLLHTQIILHLKFLNQVKNAHDSANTSATATATATATGDEEREQRAFSERAKLAAAVLLLENHISISRVLDRAQLGSSSSSSFSYNPAHANAAAAAEDGGMTMPEEVKVMQVIFSKSPVINHIYLLGTILLCQWLRQGHPRYDPLPFPPDSIGGAFTADEQEAQDEVMDKVDLTPARVRGLLRESLHIWQKNSEASKESQKATAILRLVLGEQEGDDDNLAYGGGDGRGPSSGGAAFVEPDWGTSVVGSGTTAGSGMMDFGGDAPAFGTLGGNGNGNGNGNVNGNGNGGDASVLDTMAFPLGDDALLGLGNPGYLDDLNNFPFSLDTSFMDTGQYYPPPFEGGGSWPVFSGYRPS